MKKTVLIMSAMFVGISGAIAQERNSNTPTPQTIVTPAMRQAALERDQQYEAQRKLEQEQATKNTTLNSEDVRRLNEIQQRELDAQRKNQNNNQSSNTNANVNGSVNAVQYDYPPVRNLQVGTDGMNSEADINAYNAQMNQAKAPQKVTGKVDGMTPEQRLAFERQQNNTKLNRNPKTQQLNDDGSVNMTQRVAPKAAPVETKQVAHPAGNGGQATKVQTLTPEQIRFRQATESGKSGMRTTEIAPVSSPSNVVTKPVSVSGNATQQGPTADQTASMQQRAQFQQATISGEAGRKQETPVKPVAAPVQKAASTSGNANQQVSTPQELTKEQLQFRQATQSGEAGRK